MIDGRVELARLLSEGRAASVGREVDVEPEREHLGQADELLMILDRGGREDEVGEFLMASHAERSLSSPHRDLAALADLVINWFCREVFLVTLPPLVQASARGVLDDVMDLLQSGSSPNESDDSGWAALHAAATSGFGDVVAALLAAGADPDARTNDGFTPLLNAAGPCEEPGVISLLLAAGADPNAKDAKFEWTPLSRACEYCRPSTVELLLEAGADAERIEPGGCSMLMTAAEAGCVIVVRLLLDAGVDPDAVCDGETAADMARRRGFTECLEALEG